MLRNRKAALFAVAAAATIGEGLIFGLTLDRVLLLAVVLALAPVLAYAAVLLRRLHPGHAVSTGRRSQPGGTS